MKNKKIMAIVAVTVVILAGVFYYFQLTPSALEGTAKLKTPVKKPIAVNAPVDFTVLQAAIKQDITAFIAAYQGTVKNTLCAIPELKDICAQILSPADFTAAVSVAPGNSDALNYLIKAAQTLQSAARELDRILYVEKEIFRNRSLRNSDYQAGAEKLNDLYVKLTAWEQNNNILTSLQTLQGLNPSADAKKIVAELQAVQKQISSLRALKTVKHMLAGGYLLGDVSLEKSYLPTALLSVDDLEDVLIYKFGADSDQVKNYQNAMLAGEYTVEGKREIVWTFDETFKDSALNVKKAIQDIGGAKDVINGYFKGEISYLDYRKSQYALNKKTGEVLKHNLIIFQKFCNAFLGEEPCELNTEAYQAIYADDVANAKTLIKTEKDETIKMIEAAMAGYKNAKTEEEKNAIEDVVDAGLKQSKSDINTGLNQILADMKKTLAADLIGAFCNDKNFKTECSNFIAGALAAYNTPKDSSCTENCEIQGTEGLTMYLIAVFNKQADPYASLDENKKLTVSEGLTETKKLLSAFFSGEKGENYTTKNLLLDLHNLVKTYSELQTLRDNLLYVVHCEGKVSDVIQDQKAEEQTKCVNDFVSSLDIFWGLLAAEDPIAYLSAADNAAIYSLYTSLYEGTQKLYQLMIPLAGNRIGYYSEAGSSLLGYQFNYTEMASALTADQIALKEIYDALTDNINKNEILKAKGNEAAFYSAYTQDVVPHLMAGIFKLLLGPEEKTVYRFDLMRAAAAALSNYLKAYYPETAPSMDAVQLTLQNEDEQVEDVNQLLHEIYNKQLLQTVSDEWDKFLEDKVLALTAASWANQIVLDNKLIQAEQLLFNAFKEIKTTSSEAKSQK